MIEPPAGSDPRVTMAVSPIYLESLKSYELLASGDRLFLDALEHFKLPRSAPLNTLKRSVLKVTIPHNTKVLEISATLPDPVQAQALAFYIAEQTVKLARGVALETERDLIAEAQRRRDEARERLQQVEWAWVQLAKAPAGGGADHLAKVDAAQAEREGARDSFSAAEKRLQGVRSAAGDRGERLNVVDPGVVPDRPSRPNLPLMMLAAIVVALATSVLFVSFEFNYRLERYPPPRAAAPLARVKSGNE
jgi:uncharacterized protein involved in exopolysaccharide biosynthesis